MNRQFSTRDVHPRDRLAYWQDVACKAFVEIECQTTAGPGFDATICSRKLAGIGMSLVNTDQCDVHRRRRGIMRATSDDVLLSLQLSGVATLAQDGRHTRLGVGDFALYDTLRPYTLRVTPGVRQLVLKLPRRELELRLGPVFRYSARAICADDPLGTFASGFLGLIPDRLDALDKFEKPAADDLERQIFDVIALALRNIIEPDAKKTLSRDITFARLKMSIERGLADPALKPSAAAAAAGISVRYANELLAAEGQSLERYILNRRLEHCAEVLLDPRQAARRIGDIALSCGFSDASHFGKRFRERFDQSPREYRRSTLKKG